MTPLQKEIEVKNAISELRNYIQKKEHEIGQLNFEIAKLNEEILFLDNTILDQLYRFLMDLQEIQDKELED